MTAWKRAIAATVLVAGLSSCASTGSASSQATSPLAGTSGPGSTSPPAASSGPGATSPPVGSSSPGATSPAANRSGPGSASPAVNSSRPGSTSPGDGSASWPPVRNSTSPAGTTRVPNVDSQPVPDALQLLQQDNLTVGKQEQRANLYVPSMSVITTDPAVGTPEPDGYAVTLLVSAGPPSCQSCPFASGSMPRVIGETLDQAITTLAEQDLSLQGHTSQPAPEPPGEVIASDPAPGQPVTSKTVIELVLSSGLSSPGASLMPGITPSGS